MKKIVMLMYVVAATLPLSSFAGQWSAGAVGLLQSNPYAGGEGGVNVFPAIAYEGEKLVVRGPFADYYLVGGQRDRSSLAITVGLGPNQLDVDNDPDLLGIEDRDSSILGGLRYSTTLLKGRLSASITTDLTNEHQGQRAIIGWQRPIAFAKDRRWQILGGVELEYLTSNYTQFYFGVSQEEAQRSTFAQYTPGSVVQPSVTLNGYYNITKRWQLIANLGWQVLDSDIKNSPIVDQSSVPTGLLGIIYNF